MKTLKLLLGSGYEINVLFSIGKYVYFNNTYIRLWQLHDDGCIEPYANVTVNLRNKLPKNYGFVDTNNLPELEKFLVDNKFAINTGFHRDSGFCRYPLYLFNLENIRKYTARYSE